MIKQIFFVWIIVTFVLLTLILKRGEAMPAINDLNAAIERLKATDIAVLAEVKAHKDRIKALEDEIASLNNNPAIAAATLALNAEIDKLEAIVTPPVSDKLISVGDTSADVGATFTLPIKINNKGEVTGILSVQLDLHYDSGILEVTDITRNPGLTDWTFTNNLSTLGVARTGGFGLTVSIPPGVSDICVVHFRVKDSAVHGAKSPLTIENIRLNETDINASQVGVGSVTVN